MGLWGSIKKKTKKLLKKGAGVAGYGAGSGLGTVAMGPVGGLVGGHFGRKGLKKAVNSAWGGGGGGDGRRELSRDVSRTTMERGMAAGGNLSGTAADIQGAASRGEVYGVDNSLFNLNPEDRRRLIDAISRRDVSSAQQQEVIRNQLIAERPPGAEDISTLRGLANQQGQSVAQLQLQKGLDQSIAAQRALAVSAGGNPAAAARMAAQQTGALQANAANAAAQLRAQEFNADMQRRMAAAQAAGQLGLAGGAQRLSALGAAGTLAGQQRGQSLGENQLEAGALTGLLGLGQKSDLSKAAAGQSQLGLGANINQYLTGAGETQSLARQGAFDASHPNWQQVALGVGSGMVGQGFGGWLQGMASDKNLKKDINEAIESQLEKFLDSLDPASFEYKEPEVDGDGKHYGVMAQDLEKSDVGDSMVVDTPRGKMVDYGRGLSALLAAQVDLHRRMKAIESKRG